MKTTALNGNMVITDNGGMTIMERLKRYFAENAATDLRMPLHSMKESIFWNLLTGYVQKMKQ